MGILEYELDEDRERSGRTRDRHYRKRVQRDRDDRDRNDDRENGGRGNGGREREAEKKTKKEPLEKREPVRIAEAVVTLITAGALVLFGVEVTDNTREMLNNIVLMIIPVVVPIIAGFEVARSKVDSPATVERKVREKNKGSRD